MGGEVNCRSKKRNRNKGFWSQNPWKEKRGLKKRGRKEAVRKKKEKNIFKRTGSLNLLKPKGAPLLHIEGRP